MPDLLNEPGSFYFPPNISAQDLPCSMGSPLGGEDSCCVRPRCTLSVAGPPSIAISSSDYKFASLYGQEDPFNMFNSMPGGQLRPPPPPYQRPVSPSGSDISTPYSSPVPSPVPSPCPSPLASPVSYSPTHSPGGSPTPIRTNPSGNARPPRDLSSSLPRFRAHSAVAVPTGAAH